MTYFLHFFLTIPGIFAREVTQKKQHWTGFTIPSILGVGGAPMHVNQRLKMFQPKSAAREKLWEEGHPFVPLVKGRRRRVKTKVWKTIGVPACIFDPALILSFSSPSSYPPPHTITTKQNNGSSIFAPTLNFHFQALCSSPAAPPSTFNRPHSSPKYLFWHQSSKQRIIFKS